MKNKLELGPRGVRALVALCAHVYRHGTFAKDGRELAQVFLQVTEATSEVREWIQADARLDYSKSTRAQLDRLRVALEELYRGVGHVGQKKIREGDKPDRVES